MIIKIIQSLPIFCREALYLDYGLMKLICFREDFISV